MHLSLNMILLLIGSIGFVFFTLFTGVYTIYYLTSPFASPSISFMSSHLKIISVELALTPEIFLGGSVGSTEQEELIKALISKKFC